MFNQLTQHRMRVLMKFGTGEELESVASVEENRMVAQKEAEDLKYRSEIKFGGMEYQHHVLWGQIRISATNCEPVLLGLAQEEKGLSAQVHLQAMGSCNVMHQ